jgi:NADPH2:quinone reductase
MRALDDAECVAVAADRLIALPDEVGEDVAAAALLQGLTAQYLVRDSHRIANGENVLVHAAGGGVGLLLVQLARRLGGRVIGITSTRAKAEAAEAAGAQQVALADSDWVRAARRFSSGAGVDVVYDSVGSTLLRSLDATRPRGHVVFYGMAGGDPPAIDARLLMDSSKSVTGGDLWNVLTSASERRARAAELFFWVKSGALRVQIAARVPLAEGARAHALLESRNVAGKILLIP